MWMLGSRGRGGGGGAVFMCGVGSKTVSSFLKTKRF